MNTPTVEHHPVMLQPVLEQLNIKPDGIYIDATFGRGGHSKAILQRLNENGRLYAIDKDPKAYETAQALMQQDKRFFCQRSAFTHLLELCENQQIVGKVDGILMDLGVSSPQLDEAERGFSFSKEGPLDMRMDPTQGVSAAEWVNTAKATRMIEVLKDYGEERFAKRIAHAIVRERAIEPITTTARLAKIVSEANPAWEKTKHPATRSFQAIRIYINNELNELEMALEQALEVLTVGGRLAVISFHSLEDRIVKRFFRLQEQGKPVPRGVPIMPDNLDKRLQKCGKAIKATPQEVSENVRARSAILRVAEKIA